MKKIYPILIIIGIPLNAFLVALGIIWIFTAPNERIVTKNTIELVPSRLLTCYTREM